MLALFKWSVKIGLIIVLGMEYIVRNIYLCDGILILFRFFSKNVVY